MRLDLDLHDVISCALIMCVCVCLLVAAYFLEIKVNIGSCPSTCHSGAGWKMLTGLSQVALLDRVGVWDLFLRAC